MLLRLNMTTTLSNLLQSKMPSMQPGMFHCQYGAEFQYPKYIEI